MHTTHWHDGTPIWRGPPFPEPWGTDPRDRWVKVMADILAGGVWDVEGVGRDPSELPISQELIDRIERWQDWHDDLDQANDLFPQVFYWEHRADAPLAEFNGEMEAIAEGLRRQLPSDWKVVTSGLP